MTQIKENIRNIIFNVLLTFSLTFITITVNSVHSRNRKIYDESNTQKRSA